jgi:F-box/TPR repeat protein Pof3
MPRTLSVEEYKELGKRYYGRKDYQKALDAFTEGIDASAGRDIQLYDYRAATYDKMENMTLALTDARWMIKAYEKDPRVSEFAFFAWDMRRCLSYSERIG